MKKIIDANFFSDSQLETYLKSSKHNKVVFCDYASMEAYKGNALKNIMKSTEIVSKYPNQVIVLKGTRDIVKLTLKHKNTRKFVDKQQTHGFKEFCKEVQLAGQGNKTLKKRIEHLGKVASKHFDNIEKDSEKIIEGIKEIGKSFDPKHLTVLKKKEEFSIEIKTKIINDILTMAIFHFQNHPDVDKIPNFSKVSDSYILRYSICSYLMALWWITVGGPPKGIKSERIRNDAVDMNYITYATYFDGLLTKDEKMIQIYNDTCLILKNIFYSENLFSKLFKFLNF